MGVDLLSVSSSVPGYCPSPLEGKLIGKGWLRGCSHRGDMEVTLFRSSGEHMKQYQQVGLTLASARQGVSFRHWGGGSLWSWSKEICRPRDLLGKEELIWSPEGQADV